MGDVAVTYFGFWFQSEKHKSSERFVKMNEAMELIEKQVDESKKQQDKLLSAEIKSR